MRGELKSQGILSNHAVRTMSFFRFSKSPKSEGATATGFNKQKKHPEEFRVHIAVREEKQDLVQELVTRYGYDINEADNVNILLACVIIILIICW